MATPNLSAPAEYGPRGDEANYPPSVRRLCAEVAVAFRVDGHRGDVVTAFAARALAAREGVSEVEARHVRKVAPLALAHRRPDISLAVPGEWGQDDDRQLDEIVARA